MPVYLIWILSQCKVVRVSMNEFARVFGIRREFEMYICMFHSN